METKRQIRDVINQVEDVTCRLLLEKRHLVLCTWPQICADLEMSERWAQTRYRDAVEMAQGILDHVYPED